VVNHKTKNLPKQKALRTGLFVVLRRNYFLVVSLVILDESAFILPVSAFILDESAILVESAALAESAILVESAAAEEDLLLQAAKEQAIAKANTLTLIEFFMLIFFK